MKTPDVIYQLRHALDTDDENQSARLIADYEAFHPMVQEAINNTFISACGYGLNTLIKQAIDSGIYLAGDD